MYAQSRFCSYFNPRSPHGERRMCRPAWRMCRSYFNPRSPHGERLGRHQQSIQRVYFNPRSPHGERPTGQETKQYPHGISIHAPRTGSDTGCSGTSGRRRKISIHAPRTGSDKNGIENIIGKTKFQSTLPARGATCHTMAQADFDEFQSTLPARGATGLLSSAQGRVANFNPRSPHGERRMFALAISFDFINFNPRSPHGERHAC